MVLSVFGVIFARDPGAAAAELARVARPSGRIILTAWIPEGAISELARASRQTGMDALGAPPAPHSFAWHDRDALAGLLGTHGFEVEPAQEQIAFTASERSRPAWPPGRVCGSL